MPNNYFQFKQFTIYQDQCAMKVGTDGVLLGAWVKLENPKKALDIGTGTGLLALMLAQRCNAHIDAIEIEAKSCKQAGENCKASPWPKQIKVLHTSIQDYNLDTAPYDLIICNPPFFTKSLKAASESRTIARHNHSLSLEELFIAVGQLLDSKGTFALIYPSDQFMLVSEIALQQGLHINRLTWVKPTPEKPPLRFLMECSRLKTRPIESELIIEPYGRHGYSKEYLSLTQEFYL